MTKDEKYAAAIKDLDVISYMSIQQAQGELMRCFGIKPITAAKATDRIFNGTTNRAGGRVAPILELSKCKTRFLEVDQGKWHEDRNLFELKAKAQKEGTLVYLSSARHKRKMAELNKACCE